MLAFASIAKNLGISRGNVLRERRENNMVEIEEKEVIRNALIAGRLDICLEIVKVRMKQV
jgi:hypothetical protein